MNNRPPWMAFILILVLTTLFVFMAGRETGLREAATQQPEPRIYLGSFSPCEFLPSIEVRQELSDTGSPGVVLYVQFGEKQFPSGVPERFSLLVDLSDKWYEKWELNVARVFIVKADGEIVDAPTRFAEVRLDRRPIELGLTGLQTGQTYLIAMQMIQKPPEGTYYE